MEQVGRFTPPTVGEKTSFFYCLETSGARAGRDLSQTRGKYLLCVGGGESDRLFDSSIQSPVLGESVSMYGPSDDNLNFYKDLMVKSHSAVFDIFYDQQLFFLREASGRQKESELLLTAVPVSAKRGRQLVFSRSIT